MNKGQSSPDVWRAVWWMAGALLSFMGLAIGGRELSVELGTFQILFFIVTIRKCKWQFRINST